MVIFFPGTGDIRDVGVKTGKYYSVNVPLQEGIDDASYETVFKPVISKVMEMYRPTAIVLQCGADSLTGDRLGCFNLSLKGHADCVEFVKSFNLPMLVLGGGGYTVRNVARCWAYETSVLLNEKISNEIPYNDFFEYYAPDFKLHLTPSTAMENMNRPECLQAITSRILQNLKNLQSAPSVQMHPVPPDWTMRGVQKPQEAEDSQPDKQTPALTKEGATKKDHESEFYEHDKDNDSTAGKSSSSSKMLISSVDAPENTDSEKINDSEKIIEVVKETAVDPTEVLLETAPEIVQIDDNLVPDSLELVPTEGSSDSMEIE